MNSKPTFIDLFCGCGGFTLGMERAGFRCVAAVDFNAPAVETLRRNLTHIKYVLERDLTQFRPDELAALTGVNSVDVIVGGPPCQGFSTARQVDGANHGERLRHITDAAEELREEFDLMAESGGTPREYGFKVQSHSVLMVTSQVKMRTAKSLMLSFSGSLLETVAMHRDPIILQRNLDAVSKLVSAMKEPVNTNEITKNRFGKKQNWEGHLWEGIPAAEVVDFLRCYQTHQASRRVNGHLLAQFIESLNTDNELVSWTVAFIGAAGGEEFEIANRIKIKMLKRGQNGNHTDRYSIKRLMSPRDESIDLDDAAWQAALEVTRKAWREDPGRMQDRNEPDDPNGPAIRKIRGFGANGVMAHPERGLLLLYLLDPNEAKLPEDTPPVVAFGVSFPGSSSGRKVEYKVTNILWEQEYGSAE